MKSKRMADVAKLANVSVTTVSHVINGTRKVKEETRERVLSAIEELNYSPDISAQILRTGKKRLIGFIVPDISNHFFSTLIDQVETVLSQYGYNLIVANTRETKERELTQLRFMASGSTDGCIIASTHTDYNEIAALIPDGFPMVFVDRRLYNNPHDMLVINSDLAVTNAVRHLIQQGHNRIGFIGGIQHLSTTQSRLAAYKEALSVVGLPYDEDIVRFGGSLFNTSGRISEELVDKNCTAIIIANNAMTYDSRAHLCRVHKENQVELVGFADAPADDAYMFNMSIRSRIVQPTISLGTQTANQILARINFPESPQKELILSSIFKYID